MKKKTFNNTPEMIEDFENRDERDLGQRTSRANKIRNPRLYYSRRTHRKVKKGTLKINEAIWVLTINRVEDQ
jgi:hypothetical protein